MMDPGRRRRRCSPYGRIVSNWERAGGKLRMEVTIPANTTATMHVPAKDAAEVTGSNKKRLKPMA
jgi:alpha-L-rhamnosidase